MNHLHHVLTDPPHLSRLTAESVESINARFYASAPTHTLSSVLAAIRERVTPWLHAADDYNTRQASWHTGAAFIVRNLNDGALIEIFNELEEYQQGRVLRGSVVGVLAQLAQQNSKGESK